MGGKELFRNLYISLVVVVVVAIVNRIVVVIVINAFVAVVAYNRFFLVADLFFCYSSIVGK